MSNDDDSRVSSLSRTVRHGDREFYIEICQHEPGEWSLAVVTDQDIASHWTRTFRTERGALREALRAIRAGEVDDDPELLACRDLCRRLH